MQRRHRRRRLSGVSLNASFQDTPARQSSADLSEPDTSFLDLGENDDTAERTRLRKTRTRQQVIASAITPVPSQRRNRSNRSRAGSASPYLSSGLASSSGVRKRVYNNEQLSQIYKDCIIKAQQGKINQQNAWTLHLVDNIKEITDLEQLTQSGRRGSGGAGGDGDQENAGDTSNAFARASHTIDAASKIYGYRVDSVHNTTYKVLGSIHQQNNDNDGDHDGSQANKTAEELMAERRRKQRNRNVGRSTLCEPDKLHKLDESMKSLCVEVDALFHKTASCFDEGGAKGLLMNTLYVQNGCDIVFDSQTKIEQNADLIRNGVQVDESCVANAQEIEKESQWMTQLCVDTFGSATTDNTGQFDGFTQIDNDLSTQTKPQNFVVDLEWMERVAICPLLNHFEQQICAIGANLGSAGDPSSASGGGASRQITPEKDYAADAVNDFADDDDAVLLDMPDFNAFTLGAEHDLNAQDLFHEELMTQQQHAMPEPQPIAVGNGSHLMQLPMDGGGDTSALTVDGVAGISGTAIEYVAGQNSDQIGNMGVEVLLNQSAFRDDDLLIDKLQHEQSNADGAFSHLHTRGIYKRGAMNIAAMNQVIAKLENADFESLTSFFDAKKHGNWAGPDQWYHRRYQLTLAQESPRKSRAGSRRQSVSPSQQQQASGEAAVAVKKTAAARKKERQSTRFDFMSIARGNLIDEKEFEEPNRSHNTLTQAVLDKNKKTYHTLPKDLQIKPDIFIKLFYRPNYSVWRHWMNQHRQRMQKLVAAKHAAASAAAHGDGDVDVQAGMVMAAVDDDMGVGGGDFAMADDMGMAADDDMGAMMMTADSAVMKQAAIAAYGEEIVAQNDDDENEFQYNYNNPLDVSHFVPNMNDAAAQDVYDFNLNGYDLVEVDAGKKLEKINVGFATTAKKVNVRKLKMKLWEKIDADLKQEKETGASEEQKMDTDDADADDVDADEVDVQVEKEDEKEKATATFQDTLNTLPTNISSSISVQMCFICLLHLANEKELQLVPRINPETHELQRDNFEIANSNENSAFEKEAKKINPIMVLGK